MRIVGYARVSSREQAENSHALEQQISRLKQCNCTEILCDVDSGRDDDRAEFNRLISLIRSNSINRVVVTRLDRLTRSLPTLRKMLDLFQQTGVDLVALDDAIDMSTAAGKFHLNMLGALAEMESDRLAERIRHGKEHFRRQRRASHPPFAYRVEDFKFVPDDRPFICTLADQKEWTRAEVGRWTALKYIEVKGLKKALKSFTEYFGYREWWDCALRNWLKSPVIRGHVVYYPKSKNPEIHYNTHEALITAEEGSEIEAILAENREKGRFAFTSRYPYSGLVRCAECGGGMIVNSGSKGRIQYYTCCNHKYGICKSKKGTKTEYIEAAVIDALTQASERIANEVLSSIDLETKPEESLELKDLKRQLRALEAIGFNPVIEEAKQKLLLQIQALEYTSTNQVSCSVPDGIRQLLIDEGSKPEFWLNLPLDYKRQLMKALVDRVVVLNGAVCEVRLKL